jgi:hypothetical protein
LKGFDAIARTAKYSEDYNPLDQEYQMLAYSLHIKRNEHLNKGLKWQVTWAVRSKTKRE